jgi:acyl homoserine lactone synthase
MIETLTGNVGQIGLEVEGAIAAYRHQIFIEALGWNLPISDGLERDQFDDAETVYVVNRLESGEVCGCARLLPTVRPYLLSEVFPHLLGGVPVPRSSEVWEISRFSTSSPHLRCAGSIEKNTRQLLGNVVRCAQDHGARRLITVSPIGVERILRRMGVHAHRAGPPQLVDGKPVFACWIEIDAQTTEALGVKRAQHSCVCDAMRRAACRAAGSLRLSASGPMQQGIDQDPYKKWLCLERAWPALQSRLRV